MNMDATHIKRRIGVQLQRTSLLPDLRVVEQVMLFSRLYGLPISREQAIARDDVDYMETFPIVKRKESHPWRVPHQARHPGNL